MIQKEPAGADGISLRTVYIWIVVMAVTVSALMIFSTYHLASTFLSLTGATDDFMTLERATYELMDASDYLTEKVQRFTVAGDLTYLNEYFTEAFETNRRENAIKKLADDPESLAAFEALRSAMNASRELMNQEYYAMKLVIEAKGYTDYPELLRGIHLNTADAALPAAEKLRLATETVLNESYYRQKDQIRANMKLCLAELEKLTRSTEAATSESLRYELEFIRIIIAIQAAGIIAIVLLTSRLGITPVLRAVESIRDDSPIPVTGANEFRYLARTYNRMYNVYKQSVEHLNFRASHDELTGVYNRAGYNLLLSGIELSTTYMLLIDLDDFKIVNDTYGHEMGDQVLKRLADTLLAYFRADDYVCRIGGDEFVVIMVHLNEKQRSLIAAKLNQINHELSEQREGVVPVSVSVGVAHGSGAADAAVLFEHADKALYETKRRGKKGFTFYDGSLSA